MISNTQPSTEDEIKTVFNLFCDPKTESVDVKHLVEMMRMLNCTLLPHEYYNIICDLNKTVLSESEFVELVNVTTWGDPDSKRVEKDYEVLTSLTQGGIIKDDLVRFLTKIGEKVNINDINLLLRENEINKIISLAEYKKL